MDKKENVLLSLLKEHDILRTIIKVTILSMTEEESPWKREEKVKEQNYIPD